MSKDVSVYLGTSGYKFDDWVGNFYPSNVKKVEMLEYYVQHFNLLELTYTYYKLPSYGEIKNIFDRSGGDTVFTIRLPHFFQKNKFNEEDVKNLFIALSPIQESGRLYALFVDFGYRFSACKKNLEYLIYLKTIFKDNTLFVELPNRTWYKERYISELKNNKIGLIALDLPMVTGFAPFYLSPIENKSYIRLYGRSKLWLTPETKELNYDYSLEELRELSFEIKRISKTSNLAISFCNVIDGFAPKNALKLKGILGDV